MTDSLTDTAVRPLTLGKVGGLKLRYGENAWQEADFFTQFSDDPLSLGNFVLEKGALPSQVNMTDIDRGVHTLIHMAAALETHKPFHSGIAIALKHGNCCGAGFDDTSSYAALQGMISGDTQAIFGGVVLTNFLIDEGEAETLLYYQMPPQQRRVLDVVVAPAFTRKAVILLERKADKCRIISNPDLEYVGIESLNATLKTRQVRGGHIVQSADNHVLDLRNPNMKVYGKIKPTFLHRVERQLVFASALCRTSNSNTITLVRDNMLIGQGVGQTRRDRASHLAVMIAEENGHLEFNSLRPIVACSDSFFPFADGVEPLIRAGVNAIFSTSGSVRDTAVQQACLDAGVTLYQLPDAEARMFFGH